EAVQKMLDEAESQLENGGRWHNPEAPQDYGTEKDRANCPFFIKTGACRFGDRCSRKHVHPAASTTLMIRGMFVNFGMDQSRRDDYDTDASLEYSEEEVQQQFLDFYEDVLPEFSNVGKVLQFKVSCNFEPHLRGNVYVQYETEDECREAFMQFNGRWYAGKQLQCEFSPVTRWKMAICGLFDRHKCPRGKHCNFLHVYRNPGNQFWEADRDLHMSPDRGSQFTGRFSERRDRSRRRYSRSPDGSHRRNGESDRRRSRYRSRSRERRRRQCSSSPERSRRRRSRSRERRRSHSREGHRSKGRSPSRSRSRERARRRGLHAESKSRPSVRKSRSRSPSGEGASRAGEPSLRRVKRSGSGGGPERARDKHSKSKSPGHKHVKKSKKKKGKKKKKKKNRKKSRSRSPSGSSSADSGKNSEGEGETAPQDSETPAAQEALQEDSVPDEQGEEGTGSGPATS
ncbi:U2AFM protein, partial [Amia calva]|nr:U2AFM protein [Amia calva]